jgi:hypothetical protein
VATEIVPWLVAKQMATSPGAVHRLATPWALGQTALLFNPTATDRSVERQAIPRVLLQLQPGFAR